MREGIIYDEKWVGVWWQWLMNWRTVACRHRSSGARLSCLIVNEKRQLMKSSSLGTSSPLSIFHSAEVSAIRGLYRNRGEHHLLYRVERDIAMFLSRWGCSRNNYYWYWHSSQELTLPPCKSLQETSADVKWCLNQAAANQTLSRTRY